MDNTQRLYWTRFQLASQHAAHGNVDDCLDICKDLRAQVDVGLFLRALVNHTMSQLVVAGADAKDFAEEALQLIDLVRTRPQSEYRDLDWLEERVRATLRNTTEQDQGRGRATTLSDIDASSDTGSEGGEQTKKQEGVEQTRNQEGVEQMKNQEGVEQTKNQDALKHTQAAMAGLSMKDPTGSVQIDGKYYTAIAIERPSAQEPVMPWRLEGAFGMSTTGLHPSVEDAMDINAPPQEHPRDLQAQLLSREGYRLRQRGPYPTPDPSMGQRSSPLPEE